MVFGNSRYVSPPQGVFWLAGLLFLVAGSFIVLLIYLSFSGPSGVDRTKPWEVDEAAIVEWMKKSAEEEEAFKRAFSRNPNHPEVYLPLEAAIAYQRRLNAIDPENAFGSSTRLKELIRLLEETKGSALRAIVVGHGQKAAELVARGDALSAMPLLEEALAHQEWINNHLRESEFVDMGEVSRLKQWIASLQTVDAVAEVDEVARAAKEAYRARDWIEAERLFDRALGIQESINLNMPESPHVRWRLVQELKDYKVRIEAGRMNQRIEELLSSAGDDSESDRLKRAMNLQVLLNEKYATTEFANPERLESLKLSIVSDRSQASAALLVQLSTEMDQRLRDGNWEFARRVLLELEGSVNDFEDEYSLSLLPEPGLKEKVEWLIKKQDELAEIRSVVESKLVAYPALPLQFHATEVDQALYERVMEANPSRWISGGLPVDSVSALEAQLFCKRLGWMLGQQVVLPRIDWLEFLSEVDLEGHDFWFSDNSGFRSKPVGNSRPVYGLYDCFGNLEEWVMDEEGLQALGLFGGCGADSTSKVRNEPLNRVAENFRSRWTGFRFCILDDSKRSFPSPN